VRIAIDIRRINEFGVGTYTRNIIRALAQLDRQNKYFLLGPEAKVGEIGKLPENFKTVPLDSSETVRGEMRCSAVLKRLNCDLTKSEIEKLFGINPAKIEVVYNAIDQRFLSGHATDADRQFLAERYQVTFPFVLYAGRISPQKNLVRIIEAFSALKADLGKQELYPDLKLIIIGDELSKNPDLRRTVVRGGVQNDVRFMGFLPIEVLRIFYDLAKVFVFPSLYEGFGLPPLEAMAHGTPVLTSNTSSIPEVVGNAAVMVNPENVFEIMRALERVLIDQSLREKMRQRGYEQVKKFSWKNSAQAILETYEQIAGVSPALPERKLANL
jgi:glycosyltransferase involved in cell wall biosynthesis